MSGTLYLCATPIGNLEDITLRVLRTLQEVDVIAAEDTRNTIKLLNHFEIKTPMTSYHEYNKVDKAAYLVEQLANGKNIALVTDAGTPPFRIPEKNWSNRLMLREFPSPLSPEPVRVLLHSLCPVYRPDVLHLKPFCHLTKNYAVKFWILCVPKHGQ